MGEGAGSPPFAWKSTWCPWGAPGILAKARRLQLADASFREYIQTLDQTRPRWKLSALSSLVCNSSQNFVSVNLCPGWGRRRAEGTAGKFALRQQTWLSRIGAVHEGYHEYWWMIQWCPYKIYKHVWASLMNISERLWSVCSVWSVWFVSWQVFFAQKWR